MSAFSQSAAIHFSECRKSAWVLFLTVLLITHKQFHIKQALRGSIFLSFNSVIMWWFCPTPPALRSRSGRSIINGNWAIDRPGKYEGGGTMFTYRRPNEIRSTAGESFLAEGPTNEILDVYVSNKSAWTSRFIIEKLKFAWELNK